MIHPTARLISLCVIPLGLTVAGLWREEFEAFAIVALLVVLLLAVVDLAVAPLRLNISVERYNPKDVGVARDFERTLVLKNESDRGVRVWFEEWLPAEVLSDRSETSESVGANEALRITISSRAVERGKHILGPVVLAVQGPLGLMRKQWSSEDDAAVVAIPGIQILHDSSLILRAQRDADAGIVRSRGIGRGGEFASLAPYLPGDPSSAVDWKAYARSGQLAVRHYEPERRRTVMLCCDAGRLMGSRIGGVRKVNLALESLVYLAAAALGRGDLVGMLIFDSGIQALVPPKGGPGQLLKIVHASMNVEPKHGETAYTPAFVTLNHTLSRRSLVVLATDFDSTAQGHELKRCVAPLVSRHLLLMASVRDPSLREAVIAPVKVEEDAWLQLASMGLLEERQEILNQLARSGVFAVDAEPTDLDGPLLRTYGKLVSSGAL